MMEIDLLLIDTEGIHDWIFGEKTEYGMEYYNVSEYMDHRLDEAFIDTKLESVSANGFAQKLRALKWALVLPTQKEKIRIGEAFHRIKDFLKTQDITMDRFVAIIDGTVRQCLR